MCEICRNQNSRTLLHSLNKFHLKCLKKVMLEKKIKSELKYGWFKYEFT
jgi:hypothetical protein